MAEIVRTEVTHARWSRMADAGTLTELKLLMLMLVQRLRLRRPELFGAGRGAGAASTLLAAGLRACNVRTDLGRLAMPPATTGGQ